MKKKRLLITGIIAAVSGFILWQLWPQEAFCPGKVEFSYDEIIRIFNENEEAFNYVVSKLKDMNRRGFHVGVSNDFEKNIMIDIYDKEARSFGNWVTYTDLGYEEDKVFENYVRGILVKERVGVIYYGVDNEVTFGPNQPIKYSEEELYVDEPETYVHGRIKGNWYFYIHIPI